VVVVAVILEMAAEMAETADIPLVMPEAAVAQVVTQVVAETAARQAQVAQVVVAAEAAAVQGLQRLSAREAVAELVYWVKVLTGPQVLLIQALVLARVVAAALAVQMVPMQIVAVMAVMAVRMAAEAAVPIEVTGLAATEQLALFVLSGQAARDHFQAHAQETYND
jgi:hypothetical protein